MLTGAIKLKNSKSFQDLETNNIPEFCVIAGANGVGRTTLFDVFGFLKDCLTFSIRNVIQKRGGFEELLSHGVDVADRVVEIKVKFRIEISGYERLVTYILRLKEDSGKKVYVERKILKYRRGSFGSPYHFLDFSRGHDITIINGDDFSKQGKELNRGTQQPDSNDVLAIKGLNQSSKFKATSVFRQLIENWHVSNFRINAARESKDVIGYEDHLSVTGDNLQLVTRNIHDNYPEIFPKVIDSMKHRVSGVSDVKPVNARDGRLLLGFQGGSFVDPFIDRCVSDGTLEMFVYLVQLRDPEPHPLLCVEEPKDQLYPRLLVELAEEFRAYTQRGGQVFVSTHSLDFLNAANIDEIFWLTKTNGYTHTFKASDDPQLVAYMNNGDKVEYLWKQRFFLGINS